MFPQVLLALLAIGAGAQPGNPGDGGFTLRLTARPVFHEGELIPVDIDFRAPAGSRYNFGGVLLDPAQGCGDPGHPCQMFDMQTFSKTDPLLNLGVPQRRIHAELNGYMPRLKPGRYRAALLARELVQTGSGPLSSTWGYAEPARYLTSDRVEFEIVPATREWVRQTVADAEAVLASTVTVYASDPFEFRASLAQYTLTSPADLGAKLAQFPKGTPYELVRDGRKSLERTPDLPGLP